MSNQIDYNFLNSEVNTIEMGKNLKMNYFSNGDKKFLLQTGIMKTFEEYVFFNRENIVKCIMDSILEDFGFQNVDQDTIKNLSIFSDSVVIINYNNVGDSVFKITSNELIHYSNEDIVELKNNVKLHNFKNNFLQTNRLFWNIEKNKILSLDSVLIQTSDKIINGCGFYSDDNFENYKIYNIKGVLQVESE